MRAKDLLLECVRKKFPDATLNIEDGTEEADYEICILNAMKACYDQGKRNGYAIAREVVSIPTASSIEFDLSLPVTPFSPFLSDNLIEVARFIGRNNLYQEKDKGDNWYDVNGLFTNNTEALILYALDLAEKGR